MLDAERYNIMNNQWFCAYLPNLIVLVVEFTYSFDDAVMQTLASFVKIYLAFIDRLSHGDDLISRAH